MRKNFISLFNFNKKIREGSLVNITWNRFRRNKIAVIALLWMVFSITIAFLGYLITPDSTPYSNHQQLQIAGQSPGFKTNMLFVKKNEISRDISLISKMFHGEPLPYYTTPFNDIWFDGFYVYIEEYSGDPEIAGRKLNFSLANVLFAVKEYSIDGDLATIYTIDGREKDLSIESMRKKVLEEHVKTKSFLLGTDRFGRDMLSQMIIGTRVSLSVGFIAVFISLVIGLLLGSIGGFFRGVVDDFIVWLINVVWSVPTILLVIAITFAVGQGYWQIFVAVGLTMWVEVARVVRGQILSVREKEFIEATRALGLPNYRIIIKHIIPNILGPVVVISAANFASAILIEAGLSFLGIGVQPPIPSWGNMIKENYAYIVLDKAYLAILPGICIMLSVLSLMLISNGLRDVIDKSTDIK